MTQPPSPLRTLSQLAAELAKEDPATPITYKTLKRYCHDGMRYFPDSNRIMVCREWLDMYIASRTINAEAEEAKP